MSSHHGPTEPRDPTKFALELISGARDVRELAQELVDQVAQACEPSQAALYMWDKTVGSCYALCPAPAAIVGAARRAMAEALESAWEATSVPVPAEVGGTAVQLYPIFHGTERAGVLVLVEPPDSVPITTLGKYATAAYYLVLTAAERIERMEAERRRSELEVIRSRLQSALGESHDKQRTIEKMAASLEAARAALEASHENLEAQVRERTAELASANESLSEASRRAQASSDAKSRFLAIMSHELRTPLTSILGAAELLADEAEGAENGLINTVRTAGQDVLDIVSDVLDYSRLEAGEITVEREPFAVQDVFQSLRSEFGARAESRGLALDLAGSPGPDAMLRGDRGHVLRILSILVDNAVKYTNSGTVRIIADQSAGAPSFTVSDQGPGIPIEVQDRIFSAFEQADTSNARSFEGAGLGLAIARSLARLIGGELAVKSEPGAGAEFSLLLHADAVMGSVRSPARPGQAQAPIGAGCRVLLVEDNAVNRRIVARLLTRLGHEVIEACDGEEAVDRAIAEAPDVVLMDIQMPKLDGLGATRLIRQSTGKISQVPILALTANATPEERARAFDSGMDTFLVKPIQVETLRAAIEGAMMGTVRQ